MLVCCALLCCAALHSSLCRTVPGGCVLCPTFVFCRITQSTLNQRKPASSIRGIGSSESWKARHVACRVVSCVACRGASRRTRLVDLWTLPAPVGVSVSSAAPSRRFVVVWAVGASRQSVGGTGAQRTHDTPAHSARYRPQFRTRTPPVALSDPPVAVRPDGRPV